MKRFVFVVFLFILCMFAALAVVLVIGYINLAEKEGKQIHALHEEARPQRVLKYAFEKFRANNDQRFPQSIPELTKYIQITDDSPLPEYLMPDYMKSKPWDNLRSDVIICYDKNISPERKYIQSIREEPKWLTMPRGRYVLFAGGRVGYLSEDVLQQKLKSFETEYAEQISPFSYDVELIQGDVEENNKILSLLQGEDYEQLKNKPGLSGSSFPSEITYLADVNSEIIEDPSQLYDIFHNWGIAESEYNKYKFAVPYGRYRVDLINTDPNVCLILSDVFRTHGVVISQGPIIELDGWHRRMAVSGKWIRQAATRSSHVGRGYAPEFFIGPETWKEIACTEYQDGLRGTIKFVKESFDYSNWLIKELVEQKLRTALTERWELLDIPRRNPTNIRSRSSSRESYAFKIRDRQNSTDKSNLKNPPFTIVAQYARHYNRLNRSSRKIYLGREGMFVWFYVRNLTRPDIKELRKALNLPAEFVHGDNDKNKTVLSLLNIGDYWQLKDMLRFSSETVYLSEKNSKTIKDGTRLYELFDDWSILESEYRKYKFAVPYGANGGTSPMTLVNTDPNTCLILSDAFSKNGGVISQGPVIDLTGRGSTVSGKWIRQYVSQYPRINGVYTQEFFISGESWNKIISNGRQEGINGKVEFVEDGFDFEQWFIRQLLKQGLIDKSDWIKGKRLKIK